MASDRVRCPSCDKAFRFSPKNASRKVKCSGCQAVFQMPAEPGFSARLIRAAPRPEPADQGEYELDLNDSHLGGAHAAEQGPSLHLDSPSKAPPSGGHCPSCNAPMKRGAAICINCGFDLQSGRQIQTALDDQTASEDQPAPASDAPVQDADNSIMSATLAAAASRKAVDKQLAEDAEHQHYKTERLIPMIMVGVGFCLLLINAFVLSPFSPGQAGSPASSVLILISSGILVAIQIPMLLICLVMISRIFGTGFGPLPTALLKLNALALTVDGVDACVGTTLDIITGGFGGFGFLLSTCINIGVFWLLCMMLFEMERMEMFVMWILSFLIPTWILMLVIPFIHN